METDYSKHTYFRWKVKWRLEHLGALGTMGEMARLTLLLRTLTCYVGMSCFLMYVWPLLLQCFVLMLLFVEAGTNTVRGCCYLVNMENLQNSALNICLLNLAGYLNCNLIRKNIPPCMLFSLSVYKQHINPKHNFPVLKSKFCLG